jgi:hypothetical protein
MNFSPTPTQTLILWFLIGCGRGSAWLSDIRPRLEAGDRKRLEQARLIVSEKRRKASTDKGGKIRHTNAIWIELTDAGWAWANDHLDAVLPGKTQSAGPILHAWLSHLQGFIRRRGIALAELIGSEPPEPPIADLEERIRRACLQLTGGARHVRVHLHQLRRVLSDVPRAELDAALLAMQRDAKLVLFNLDNQREITAEDRQAALYIAGEPRYVLRLGG